MASLFKPRIVRYRLPSGKAYTPEGKLVTSKTPHAVRTVHRAKKWYGRYGDGKGKMLRVPLSENKEVARDMLAKLVNDAAKARLGIRDPFAPHRDRPLEEHLEDFRLYLAGKGNVPAYVANTVQCCYAILEGCQFHYAAQMQPSPIVQFLAAKRASPRQELGLPPSQKWFTKDEVALLLGIQPGSVRRFVGAGQLRPSGKDKRFARANIEQLLASRRPMGVFTSNNYLAAIKHFSRWLVKDGRTERDPLAMLARQNAEVDRRRPRRALSEEQFGDLVEATGKGVPFRDMTGPDRLVLYTLAANTGFRAKELSSLTPASFALGSKPATVTVEAGYSKHRRKDVQPLRPDVAEMMRQYTAGKATQLPLWPGKWAKLAAEMLRKDLDAAGIPYRDEAGRVFDFHAIRGQFISFLAARGVHPKVAQTLARHSTITLTMQSYTHLDVFDVAGALDKLPEITKPAPPSSEPKERKHA
jgi:integrase